MLKKWLKTLENRIINTQFTFDTFVAIVFIGFIVIMAILVL